MTEPAGSELRRYWPVVLAFFCVAVFSWGYGFYGHAIYLARHRAEHGWSAASITAATTTMYLGGALTMPWVFGAMRRFGPRAVLTAGIGLLGCGAMGFAAARQPWHLFAAAVPMAIGWGTSTGTAIATAMSFWFDRQRPIALSLALNGASASGFIVAPMLVQLGQAIGIATAVPLTVLGFWCFLLPLLIVCVGPAPVRTVEAIIGRVALADSRPAPISRMAALCDPHFRSVAVPFALALAAQVGFIVHMVSFLLPTLGPGVTSLAISLASAAAMAGRIGAGLVIHRIHQRRFSAMSFLLQAAGLGLMGILPDQAWALFAGSLLFGLSVGNVITLPAIVIQREFAAPAFGLLVGLSGAIGQFMLSIGPLLFGVLRDAADGYGPVLVLCVALQITAAWLVVRR